MTAIELYRHELALYKARRAPIEAAEIEKVRATIARLEQGNPLADHRAKARARSGAISHAKAASRRLGKRTASPTHYRCGHPRTPENTYTRKRRSDAHGELLKPNTECKTCAKARNSTRERSKEACERRRDEAQGIGFGERANYVAA